MTIAPVTLGRGSSWLQSKKMDQVLSFVEPCRQFTKDSLRLVKRCTKPDRKEFQKIAMATAIGFGIMGFIGFFVKLIHIPINNIIVGS
ncbi:protein transport protein Sec61 subunit gamma [Caerostris extrusa]|uniref:Protein transport protein Sec61 subunit gamma n=1 Tax=Caerostris extrusa TaxID=172846 RepID=A0AAV4S7U4_CAEEX|nr:protein transport protein Sec61 subunit gamma [Caerostris extrusa]